MRRLIRHTGWLALTILVLAGGAGLLRDVGAVTGTWSLPTMTNGQLLIGSTGRAPVAATLTQGSNITITNAAGAITIAGTAVLSVKTGSFTRDTSLASGTQAITGIGFTPKVVIFLAIQDAGSEMSVGMDDGVTAIAIADGHGITADTWKDIPAESIVDLESSGVSYRGHVSSFDADGFTVTWTRVSTPTGILTVKYLALR